MLKFKPLCTSIIAIGLLSCNIQKKSNKSSEPVVAVANITDPTQEKEKYRLTISFFSKGAGTDRIHHPKFKEFISNYKPVIAYEEARWGREGEIDYCFKLNELSTAEQEVFIEKAREILAGSDLVHINENAECVHKR